MYLFLEVRLDKCCSKYKSINVKGNCVALLSGGLLLKLKKKKYLNSSFVVRLNEFYLKDKVKL